MRRRALNRPVRAVAAGAALLGLVLSSAACNPGRPAAATVEGEEISADRLDELLGAFVEADADLFGTRLDGDGDDTYRMSRTSEVLGTLVLQMAQAELADREGITADEAERTEAEDLVRTSFVSASDLADAPDAPTDPEEAQTRAEELSAAVFDALSDDTRAWLIDLRAATLALVNETGDSPEEISAQAEEIFAADPSAFADRYCLRAIVVDEGDLAGVQDRLAGGEDFGALSAEVSIDPQIAQANGELGQCLPEGQLAEAGLNEQLVPIVEPLQVGDVSEPFALAEGAVAIFERREVTFTDVQAEIEATLPGPEAAAAELVRDQLEDVDVRVDPRFGTWNPTAGTVIPPTGARSPQADSERVEVSSDGS